MAMDDQPVESADIESTDEEQAGRLGAKTFMGIAALVLVIGLGPRRRVRYRCAGGAVTARGRGGDSAAGDNGGGVVFGNR